jgi:hypothetical protein
MDLAAMERAYNKQQSRAKYRGIGWEISFDEWCAWWGNDFDQRGRNVGDLQMCRIGDVGPYKLGNIYKGTPRDNAKTRGCSTRNARTLLAHKAHQEALDNAEVVSDDDEWADPEEMSVSDYYAFKASKLPSPSASYKRMVGAPINGKP